MGGITAYWDDTPLFGIYHHQSKLLRKIGGMSVYIPVAISLLYSFNVV